MPTSEMVEAQDVKPGDLVQWGGLREPVRVDTVDLSPRQPLVRVKVGGGGVYVLSATADVDLLDRRPLSVQ